MNDFQMFNDFRAGAWLDGVTMKVAAVEEAVKTMINKVVLPAMVAASFVAASVISVPSAMAAAPIHTPNEQNVVSVLSIDAEVDKSTADLEDLLAGLATATEASVDQEVLAQVRSSVAANASRPFRSPVAIAEAFFPEDM